MNSLFQIVVISSASLIKTKQGKLKKNKKEKDKKKKKKRKRVAN